LIRNTKFLRLVRLINFLASGCGQRLFCKVISFGNLSLCDAFPFSYSEVYVT